MILRELTLQNFRSYGDTPTKIELDNGVLLFEGDIGSGKSSILYAIEFALFGLGELEARSVLRSSASIGKVELQFDVGGKEYKVTRTIERKKGKTGTIRTRGWISEPESAMTELSPTELKSRVLQILDFREKQSATASSRIYRYAVFTPQELMKEVLSQRPEDRIDTLRRAFGVEDYSFASVNTGIVLNHLDKQIKIYSKLSENLPEKESQLESLKIDLSQAELRFQELQQSLQEKKAELENGKSDLSELEDRVEKIKQIQTQIPMQERNLSQLQAQLSDDRVDLQRNSQVLEEIGSSEREIFGLRQDYEKYLALREKLRDLGRLSTELRSVENEISKLNKEIVSREANLKAELESKTDQSRKIKERIQNYQNDISSAIEIEENVKRLNSSTELLPKLQAMIEGKNAEIGSARTSISSRKLSIVELQKKLKGINGISNQSTCPLCGQKLDAQHLKNIEVEYDNEIERLSREEALFQIDLARFKDELGVLEKERNEGLEARTELERLELELARIQQLNTLISTSTKEYEDLELSIGSIRSTLQAREFASEYEERLKEANSDKVLLLNSIKNLENDREYYQRLEDSGILETYQRARSIISKKGEVQEQKARLEKKIQELEIKVSKTVLEIKEKKNELEQSEPTMLLYVKTKDRVTDLEENYRHAELETELLADKITRDQEDKTILSREVEDLQKHASIAVKSRGISSWLDENFLPAIGDIEKYVLSSINEEFAQIFQKIFVILSSEEGGLTVNIDDLFTPVIEQSGYELDVQSLSGGERTALALAYRLALNYMVKRANESLQTNLLILDEPTEGFSREQIYRFRNALEELSSDQVIIVSHERDLESMADRVFRIEKENGESVVTILTS